MSVDLRNDPRRQASLSPPRLRGVLHSWCVPLALIAGIALVIVAPTDRARLLGGIFAASVLVMFSASAAFHRGTWTDEQWWRMRKIDQTAIYVILAGSYTGLAGLALSDPWRLRLLIVVWIGIAMGIAMVWHPFKTPFGLNTAVYVVISAVIITRLGDLWNFAGPGGMALIFGGMMVYFVGGLSLGARVPRLSPKVFGYHEFWHLLVLIAVAMHYCAVLFVIFPKMT